MAPPRPLHQLSEEALFRYQVVSEVQVRLLGGHKRAQAVAQVLELEHQDLSGRRRHLSERTLYRWLEAYERDGLEGLERSPRAPVEDSAVLSREFLEFLQREKRADKKASLPEIIARARVQGILACDESVDRTSVWRAARRLDLPLTRARRLAETDMRRFAYPNRMLMVLADGKRFRAGAARHKRLSLVFLDDATRYGLDLVVGTEETCELFLQGLYSTVRRHGLMNALYLDNGPGFIADDTRAAAAQLGVHLIYGTARYPEGHGKIERFNSTFHQKLLRSLDGSPEVDTDPSALRLRLLHWLQTIYNHTPHEGIGHQSPEERWGADPRPLRFPQDLASLEAAFLLTFERTVSPDNVVSSDGRPYEVPRGHANERVRLTRHLLEGGALSICHEGRLVRLHPLDPTDNAYSRRSRPPEKPPDTSPPPQTAAKLSFEDTFQPLVGPDGGFPLPAEKDENPGDEHD